MYYYTNKEKTYHDIFYKFYQFLIPAVPPKWFGSPVFDTICTIYLSLSSKTADPIIPNPFRGTHCSRDKKKNTLETDRWNLQQILAVLDSKAEI